MKLDPLTTFLEALRQSEVLPLDRWQAISQWAKETRVDAQSVAKELVQRGWMTVYQVKQVWKGYGNELVLGQYLLLDKLGEGGMGEVFKARHRRMERDVALKVIRKERLASPEAVRRFQREIQATAQLVHPNIVMAYDADQVRDRHFFAMEYVEGCTLSELVRQRGPLPVREACDYIRQAATGLQHAHDLGMVHRDIKPSNLLLAAKGGIVKILDMGLARLQEGPDGEMVSRITQEGHILGTPDFLAPEQARNPRTADIRADIYALGCSLFYLLTAQVPFPGGTTTEKLLRHWREPPPDLRTLRPDLPPGLPEIVSRTLAKRPEDRYQTPEELVHALEPYCRETLVVGPAPVAVPVPLAEPVSIAAPYAALPAAMPQTVPIAQAIQQLVLPAQPSEPRTESRFRLPPPTPSELQARVRSGKSSLLGRMLFGLVFLASLGIIGFVVWHLLIVEPQKANVLEKSWDNSLGMKMILLPPGKFLMGAPDTESFRKTDECPQHEVELTEPIYFAELEVTQKQFDDLMGFNPAGLRTVLVENAELPVWSVSWHDANRFCQKLNEREPNRRAGWEYRLPTEAEWEYASRTGKTTRFGYGDTLAPEKQAVFNGSIPYEGTVSVKAKKPERPMRMNGQRAANDWGLYDMHGNVWEWCLDWYDAEYYQKSPKQNPRGPATGAKRVMRGGAFDRGGMECRSATRRAEVPDYAGKDVGLRVVFAPKSNTP